MLVTTHVTFRINYMTLKVKWKVKPMGGDQQVNTRLSTLQIKQMSASEYHYCQLVQFFSSKYKRVLSLMRVSCKERDRSSKRVLGALHTK